MTGFWQGILPTSEPFRICPACDNPSYEPGQGCLICGHHEDGDDGAPMVTDEAEFDDEGEQEEN